MPNAALNQKQIAEDTRRFDEYIARVQRSHAPEKDLLLEHLNSARSSLLGAMPGEYIASLQAARDSASKLSDADLGRGLGEELKRRLQEIARANEQSRNEASVAENPNRGDAERPREPAPERAASPLWHFFGGSPTQTGTFYPKSFIVASLPSLEAARGAEKALWDDGFSREEVRVIPGQKMTQFLEELRAKTGLWGAVMAKVSEFFGTEQVFADHDRQKAREGAAFLGVYSPDDAIGGRVERAIGPFHPTALHKYKSGSVESTIPPRKTTGPEL